jgi:hypothetical protein
LSALAPVAGNDLRHRNISGASLRLDFEEQANSLRSCFACSGPPRARASRGSSRASDLLCDLLAIIAQRVLRLVAMRCHFNF